MVFYKHQTLYHWMTIQGVCVHACVCTEYCSMQGVFGCLNCVYVFDVLKHTYIHVSININIDAWKTNHSFAKTQQAQCKMKHKHLYLWFVNRVEVIENWLGLKRQTGGGNAAQVRVQTLKMHGNWLKTKSRRASKTLRFKKCVFSGLWSSQYFHNEPVQFISTSFSLVFLGLKSEKTPETFISKSETLTNCCYFFQNSNLS